MGFAPSQVGEMSLWQFAATVDGYNRANTPEKDGMPQLSDQEFDDIARLLDET